MTTTMFKNVLPYCRQSVAVLAVLLAFTGAVSSSTSDDVGYERMFETWSNEVDATCYDVDTNLPAWLNGSWILPTVGQFELGGRAFTSILDAFGKLHRFQFSSQRICERAKMMSTGFYNVSQGLGTVGPGMMFNETLPSRACPVDSKKIPSCNLLAPNDNTFVNTIKLGDEYTTWTDSTVLSTLDPYNLTVTGVFNYSNSIGYKLHQPSMASAHPLRRDGVHGDLVTLLIDTPMLPDPLEHTFLEVLTISDAEPHARSTVRSEKLAHSPYFHSFGVTPDFVILPYTPIRYNSFEAVLHGGLGAAFTQEHDSTLQTVFRAVPLNGSAPLEFEPVPGFTFNHVVNSYQNDTAIVFDVVAWQNSYVWMLGEEFNLSTMRNKAARDALNERLPKEIWRYVLHLGSRKVDYFMISQPNRYTDFPKVNMHFSTHQHCIYYAVEQFHNDKEYGSTAIVKHNICSGLRSYWHEPSHFLSEPFFISRIADGAEDDGVVVFAAMDGVASESYIVVVDAATFSTSSTLVKQKLKSRITFTTHGEWFPGMVDM